MTTLRTILKDDERAIPERRLSRDMIRLVRKMGKDHALDVRMGTWVAERPDEVAAALEAIISKHHAAAAKNEDALEVMLVAKGMPQTEIDVLMGRIPRGGGGKPKCDFCHGFHTGQCLAKMLTEGQVPANWTKKPEHLRKSVLFKAENIKPGCTKNLNLSVLEVVVQRPAPPPTKPTTEVLSAERASLLHDIPTCTPTRASPLHEIPTCTPTVALQLDSKAAPEEEYHFIADISLFSTLSPLAKPVTVSIGGKVPSARFIGDIMVKHPETGQVTTITNCLYSPEFPHNILNIWELRRRGAVYDMDKTRAMRDKFDMLGAVYDVGRDCSIEVMRARPPSVGLNVHVLAVETVQRGLHGKLHIDANAMAGQERAEFELHLARFNDPGLDRVRSMAKVADGVPAVLSKANAVNTATLARFLADPPQSAPKAGSTPVAEAPGDLTQIDIYKGPCKSVNGNSYMSSATDSYSGNFKVYPIKTKDVVPQTVDRYFLDAKAAKVGGKGGVLYSDNEIVLNSVRMNKVAATHDQTRRNSVEYTPTGNAGAENVYRLVGHEMRKSLIRAGMPDEFWDNAAMDAQDVLEATRDRGGVSPGEKYDGKRRDVSKRRVFGCLVVAKKLPTWVESKTDDRGALGVNLGRSHGKPGWNVWTPDFGLLTSKHVTFYETVFPFKDGTFALDGSTGGGYGGSSFEAAAMGAAPTAEDDQSIQMVPGGEAADSVVANGEAAEAADDAASQQSGSGLGHGNNDSAAESDEEDEIGIPLVPGNPGMIAHHQSRSASSQSQSQSLTHSSQMLDDEDSSGVEADPNQSHEGRTGLFVHIVEAVETLDIIARAPESTTVEVLLSTIKKAKKDREQRESGVPPPWRGLHAAPDEVKQLFMEPEMKEIDGILDTASAIETLLETLPPGTKVYETLTLRDIKKNGPKKGKPKVRVVVKKGPSDVESHSPTIQMSTLRLLLAMAAAKKAKIKGGDFPQAYLNAEQEVYYVYPPKTSRQYDEQGRRIVWALPKALYGGRASGRHWYFTLRKHLLADGFVVSEWDPCLFIKTDKDGNFHYIGVYVDDLIHVYSDETAYQATVDKFAKVFHGYTDLGTLTEILNAEVAVTEQSITLTQTRYVDALIEKFLDAESHAKVYTPAESDLLQWVMAAADGTALSAEDHALYREIVGAILYIATVCRPDISIAVGLLSRALEHPTAKCLEAAKRVLNYLRCTREIGLRWMVGADLQLRGMSDSDWAVVKSTSGYIFMLAQAAIAYISKKQVSIAMSSTESEIMAASLASLEAVFLRGILAELDALQREPTVIGIDNQGAIALSKNYVSNSRTKHIERRHLKIRELVEELKVKPEFLPTDDNPADMMTKPLGKAKFEKFRRFVLNHGA